MTDEARLVLLPCPFCGRSDLLGFEPVEREFLAVVCRACGGTAGGNRSETEPEAAAAWNRRAAAPSLPEQSVSHSMRDACINACRNQLDYQRQQFADERARQAKGTDAELDRLRHASDVRLYNAGIERCIEAIKALPEPDTAESREALTDADLTRIYKEANGEAKGKSRPLTTESIFRAMRAVAQAAEARMQARNAEDSDK